MKQRLMGSKKFWMVLVAILGVFILMASVLLLFDYSNKTVNNGYQQQGTYVEQPTTGEVDHSFEATKDRVDSINSNYGQQIKSAYSGETSAMEKMTVGTPTPVSIASVTRSKETTLSMTPPAKLKSRLTVRLESFCSSAPIRPPRPVPPIPAIVVVSMSVPMTPMMISNQVDMTCRIIAHYVG